MLEAFGKTSDISVVADPLTVAELDRVYRTNLACTFGQAVEVGDDSLFVRVSDVQPCQTDRLCGVQYPRQIGFGPAACRKIVKRIDEPKSLAISFAFMKPWRAGCQDVASYQSGQDAGTSIGKGRTGSTHTLNSGNKVCKLSPQERQIRAGRRQRGSKASDQNFVRNPIVTTRPIGLALILSYPLAPLSAKVL